MIYMDNAATSWPKPESVYLAIDSAMRKHGGNPGRSGHSMSLSAGRIIEEARMLAAELFSIPDYNQISFTMNATDALNMAIKGALLKGGHVITSSMEHNSVARPLEALKGCGVEYTKIPTSLINGVDVMDVKTAIKKNTKLMVFTHVSNVTGVVNPIEEIGAICKERGILLLVDAAQSAGTVPIDVNKMNIDLLAFPGHKGLMGPQGTGGLYVRSGITLTTLREGGTGSHSELLSQPVDSPFRYESGTPNTPGIAGLAAGIRFLLDKGVESVSKKETALINRLINSVKDVCGLTVYGPGIHKNRSGVMSVTIDGIDAAQCAIILDGQFGIAARAGLHCSPDAHKTIGTIDSGGTLRISVGYFNTEEDVDLCAKALGLLASEFVL